MKSEYHPHSVFTPFLRRFTDEPARELSETIALYHTVRAEHQKSVWSPADAVERLNNHCVEIIGQIVDLPVYRPLAQALDCCQTAVIKAESTIFSFPEIDWARARLSMKEQVDLRRFLRAKQHFLGNEDRVFELLVTALGNVFGGTIQEFPHFPADDQTFTVPLYTLLSKPGTIVDKIVGTLTEETLVSAGLFSELQEQFYQNVCRASDIVPYSDTKRRLITAAQSELPADELIEAYLAHTPFLDLLKTPVPMALDLEKRFSHHWIVGPPGTGKSTLLQQMIAGDLDLVANDEASIVIMESNRDLIKAIEGLRVFAPGEVLEGKLLSIDLEDVEWPIAMNLFDIGLEHIQTYPPAEREALLNSVLSLYTYIFSSLLSAELTSRQSTLFNFTIELLLQIPGATLDTLIDLMQPKGIANFEKHLPKLSYDAQRFFQLKFNSSEHNKTKDQVVDRLFAVKRMRTLARMFAAQKSKLDFFTEMASAKVILINAPVSLLQADGVEIVGRFFLAMILLAAQKRQLLPRERRLPCLIYIDECQDFIRRDTTIPVILDQARKLKVGCVLAHQRLNQMQHDVLDALYGATAIKMAAQVSDAGAHALARDMRTTPETILGQRPFHFATFIRGVTANAVSVGVPALDLNKAPRMSSAQHAAVRDEFRDKYATHYSKIASQPSVVSEPPGPAPVQQSPQPPTPTPRTSSTLSEPPAAHIEGADKW